MQNNNPSVIPRNHRVEEALEAAVEQEDLSLLRELLVVLSDPYKDYATNARFQMPASAASPPYKTYCGT